MKTPRIALALIPILLLAASSRHEAVGTLRFGMTGPAATNAVNQFATQVQMQKHRQLDASDIRNHFVTGGTRMASRLVAKDAAIPVQILFKADPLVTEVSVSSPGKPAVTEGNAVKEAWEVFGDIGDAKFTRIGKKGEYPAQEVFNDTTKDIVTDTWEAEGIRIEEVVHSEMNRFDIQVSWVTLRATEIPAE